MSFLKRFQYQLFAWVMITTLGFFGLLCASKCAFADDSSAGATAIASDPNLQQLESTLKKRIISVDQPVYFYHWHKIQPGETSVDKLSRADLYTKVSKSIDAQKIQYQKGDGDDSGYYVATDPAASRNSGGNVGGKDWSLTQIEAPKGFTYLDLAPMINDSFTMAVSEETKNFAKQATKALKPYCPSVAETNFTENSGKPVFVEPKDTAPACLSVLSQIVSDLHVDGLYYNYGQSLIPGCSFSHPGALVFTSTSWLNPDSITPFSADTTSQPEDRQYIQSLFSGDYKFAVDQTSYKLTYAYFKLNPGELDLLLQELEKEPGTAAFVQKFRETHALEDYTKMMEATNPSEILWADAADKVSPALASSWAHKHYLQCAQQKPFVAEKTPIQKAAHSASVCKPEPDPTLPKIEALNKAVSASFNQLTDQ